MAKSIFPAEGSASGEAELLWLNPKPTAGFGGQTLTSESAGWVEGKVLSDYEGVIIRGYARNDNGSGYMVLEKCATLSSVPGLASMGTWQGTTSGATPGSRGVTVNQDSIVFTTGRYSTTNSGGWCIPVEIWGLKKYFDFTRQ